MSWFNRVKLGRGKEGEVVQMRQFLFEYNLTAKAQGREVTLSLRAPLRHSAFAVKCISRIMIYDITYMHSCKHHFYT